MNYTTHSGQSLSQRVSKANHYSGGTALYPEQAFRTELGSEALDLMSNETYEVLPASYVFIGVTNETTDPMEWSPMTGAEVVRAGLTGALENKVDDTEVWINNIREVLWSRK